MARAARAGKAKASAEITKSAPKSVPNWLSMKTKEGGGGRGISHKLWDRAAWLDDEITEEWIDALDDFDSRGDKASLIQLLLTSGSRRDFYLADLLHRYELKRKRGRSATPAYQMTDIEFRTWWAAAEVREALASIPRRTKNRGACEDQIIERAAAAHGITTASLRDALEGRSGHYRRMRQRVFPRKKK